MTERTFRDPSPSRNTSSNPRGEDVPPVPALPKGYMSPPPLPTKSNKRAASVEPPERILSPPPLPNGRGVSLDRGPGVMPSQLKARIRAQPPQPSSPTRPDTGRNRESVNFSRPMSPMSSPPSSPIADRHTAQPFHQVSKQQTSNAANVGRLRDGESENIQYSVQAAAQAPVKKKKKKKMATNLEGTHLASGVSGGRATGTLVAATPERQLPSTESTPSSIGSSPQNMNGEASLRPVTKKKTKKKNVTTSPSLQAESSTYGSYASDSDSAISEQSNLAERPRTYNTRAAGLLAKQPSIVREDREAEEQEDSPRSINGSAKPAQNAKTVKDVGNIRSKGMMNGQQPAPASSNTTSLVIPHSGSNSGVQPARQQSLSPARAAHFSAQPVLQTPDNLKHQPPARSISPVKSALKHSPSRGPSPVAGSSVSGTPRHGPASEASDTISMISDEGYKSVPKKKKSISVSFDDESVVVGRSATPPPADPNSPLIMSPQNKDASTLPLIMSPQNKDASTRKWLGLDKEQAPLNKEPNLTNEYDTAIEPTPALPSFGSVRRQGKEEIIASSTQERSESSARRLDQGPSSDQRIGGILSRVFGPEAVDHAAQSPVIPPTNEPLPPQVTSVEGSGYHSDTDVSADGDGVPDIGIVDAGSAQIAKPKAGLDQAEPVIDIKRSLSSDLRDTPQAVDDEWGASLLQQPPSIAIQPATPGFDENQTNRDQYWLDIPGGFPSFSDESAKEDASKSTATEDRRSDQDIVERSIEKREETTVAAQHLPRPPDSGELLEDAGREPVAEANEDSEDTNNSIYSDAAEDLSDIEGDGFGSINAIVESPVSPALGLADQKRNQSPTGERIQRPSQLDRNESELSEPGPDAGWDKAQAYWSGLSQNRKQEIERLASQGVVADLSDEKQLRPTNKKKKKIVPKQPVQRASLPTSDKDTGVADPGGPSLRTRPGKSKLPALKSSMRNDLAEAPQEHHMRSSMRGSPPSKSSTRTSLPPQPNSGPTKLLPKKTRPFSADYNKPSARTIVNGHNRSSSLGTGPVSMGHPKAKSPLSQPIGRTLSNGSDSSSSFKKARPKQSDNGRYTMKRSMRGSSVDERPTSMHGRASSMTARTSSPADNSRRPFNTGPSMRNSMREPIKSGNSNRNKSPSRFPGFGKSSKAKAAGKGPTSRFSSRFADSSDEDDGPAVRRSRFADSSDQDEPSGFTPVRGIPRRIEEGDSTDLEDSSADEKVAPKDVKAKSQQPAKHEGTALGAGSLRAIPEGTDSPSKSTGGGLQAVEKEKKKRSFFGGLGSRKTPKAEPVSVPKPTNGPKQDNITSKPAQRLGVSTPDAPATPQSPKQQRLLGPGSPTLDTSASPTAQKTQKSPKLQRRISAQQAEKIQMKRGMSDSWPLPQSPGGTTTPTMRPTTSDGTPKFKNGAIGASGLSNEVQAARPGMGDRVNTVETTATGGTGMVKKKGWFKKTFGRGKG